MVDDRSTNFPHWSATRQEGLSRLECFVLHAGNDYSQYRNYDYGPNNRENVSVLSPYIRHRLITEAEVVDVVLAQHSFQQAEKFIQEVFWRTYWKGWLEMRPGVWQQYQSLLRDSIKTLEKNVSFNKSYDRAVSGNTGIECFDAWAKELLDTGYLHNHARMWFASIWIFTLNLPWQLGADFFLRHLLDGDPASNTLSWRWVAGLQTLGKHYLAQPNNIEKFTAGRFVSPQGLNLKANPLPASIIEEAKPLPVADQVHECGRIGLLLTEEDLHPESLPIPTDSVESVAGFACTQSRSALPVGHHVLEFAKASVRDGLDRAQRHFSHATVSTSVFGCVEEIVRWATDTKIGAVVCGYAPIGPVQQQLGKLKSRLTEQHIELLQIRRSWDENAWPYATKGFFAFKKRIPQLLTK